MHDLLRQRLLRHIEALPEAQLYQALDYVEFLSAKYARESARTPSPLQRFGERLEDSMRAQGLAVRTISGTLGAFGAADRVLSGISEAGRSIIREVEQGIRASDESPRAPVDRSPAPKALPEPRAQAGDSDNQNP